MAAHATRARLRAIRDNVAQQASSARPTPVSASSAKAADASPVQADEALAARTMPAPVGSGNQSGRALGNYIQSVVRQQFTPLAIDCYRELLAREPDAKGTFVLSVEIGGHPSVGGVVERVQRLPESTLRDAALDTCMIESMMALQFDAPPDGRDRIDFTYPFELSP